MSKVDINYGNLKYSCVQNLDDAISNLNKVITNCNQIDIPRDFTQASTLREVMRDIINCKNRISDTKNWVINSNSDFDNLLQNLTYQANKISTCVIKRKNNSI